MSDPIQFLTDENFDLRIVAGLQRRQPQIDVVTAAEASILGLPDLRVLAYAAEHHRILLSHDVKTMPAHFDAFLASGRHSPGLLLVAQALPIREAIDELLLIWGASDPVEWRNLRRFLPL